MHQIFVKRTIYQAKCKCGEWEDTKTENPPREKQCPRCSEWNKYEEISSLSPEYNQNKIIR